MADESEKISLEFIGEQLKRLLSGQTEMKADIVELKETIVELKETTDRIDRNVSELNVAVANLTVSNRHLRADVSKILAESGDHESRIARIEQHLGLAKA